MKMECQVEKKNNSDDSFCLSSIEKLRYQMLLEPFVACTDRTPQHRNGFLVSKGHFNMNNSPRLGKLSDFDKDRFMMIHINQQSGNWQYDELWSVDHNTFAIQISFQENLCVSICTPFAGNNKDRFCPIVTDGEKWRE